MHLRILLLVAVNLPQFKTMCGGLKNGVFPNSSIFSILRVHMLSEGVQLDLQMFSMNVCILENINDHV